MVKASTELARIGLEDKHGNRISWETVPLPFEDTLSTNDNIEFMKIAARILNQELRILQHVRSSSSEQNTDTPRRKVVLNVAGGRKNMCITLSLVGQLLGVHAAYHVVNKNYREINMELERLRPIISKLLELDSKDEKKKLYQEHRNEFTVLLFPPASEYDLIQIPLIPFPRSIVSRLLGLRVSHSTPGPFKKDELRLDEHYIDELIRAGLFTSETDKKKLYFTDLGIKILDALLGAT